MNPCTECGHEMDVHGSNEAGTHVVCDLCICRGEIDWTGESWKTDLVESEWMHRPVPWNYAPFVTAYRGDLGYVGRVKR